jgi:CRP-like cAMP-binding protein
MYLHNQARTSPRDRAPLQNHLLASLPAETRVRVLPKLECVLVPAGKLLCATEVDADCVYFPMSCVVSLLYTTREGSTTETGLVGNDGLVGLSSLMGGGSMPSRAVVQVAGDALKMKGKVLRDEFANCGPFQELLLRYTQVLLTQIAQTAVCNRLHSVEKRLCRRLLLCRDRLDSDYLIMTQEFIARTLGGRRESVTLAARRLKCAGLIRYSRGHIEILSRPGLESAACECYRVVRNEEDRLLCGDCRNSAKFSAGV